MASDLVFSILPVQTPPAWISGSFKQAEGYGTPHGGVDYATNEGEPVWAPADGKQ